MSAADAIAVVSVARSDVGLYVSVVEALVAARARVELHLPSTHAAAVAPLVAAGGLVVGVVDSFADGDDELAAAVAAGALVAGFARTLHAHRPRIVVVLGDRWEMHAAAAAAALLGLPLAHIHGGELSLGAVDDALRHAMTKLAHLHFVSTESHARRVRQLGEEDWRIEVVGAPGLDVLRRPSVVSFDEWSAQASVLVARPFALVTWHPVTRHPDENLAGVDAIFESLEAVGLPALVTAPGRDPAAQAVRARLHDRLRAGDVFVENLGEAYAGALRAAAVMVGNSSSGIIEAGLFGLPVVDVGTRQRGRERGENVFDADVTSDAVTTALRTALAWRVVGRPTRSPYDRGGAGVAIARRLLATPVDERLLFKLFIDR